jgi:type VI secretion system secreted protein VgrG
LDEGTLVAVRYLEPEAPSPAVAPGPVGDLLRKAKTLSLHQPAPAEKPAPAPEKPAVSSGLGPGVDDLVSRSPSAQAKLKAFKSRHGTVEWGRAGGGSYYDGRAKKIVIDGNKRDAPVEAMRSLSHELGHANSPVVADHSSRELYVRSLLDNEGEATLSNCEVRAEILANGGPDIGVSGQNARQYEDIYAGYLTHGNRPRARDAIGQAFGTGERTSTTGEPYAEYYGKAYDTTYGKP